MAGGMVGEMDSEFAEPLLPQNNVHRTLDRFEAERDWKHTSAKNVRRRDVDMIDTTPSVGAPSASIHRDLVRVHPEDDWKFSSQSEVRGV